MEPSKSSPVVETQYGQVRGVTVQNVHIFKGIPYGGPTGGAGRFLPPSRPAKWDGIYEATKNGPRCVQGPGNIFLDPIIGAYFRGSQERTELAAQEDSENCLVLNVSTPGLHGKRPVMVYIHGGGYTGGSGLLTVFADAFPRQEDVVLVGVNHRINVFGYLYLGGLSARYATGNAGQLDLIAALEWVRDNIANFGGDPENVTLAGESGGGGKISTLMAMPAARGLFHKAIIESGPLLNASDPEAATAYARELLKKLDLAESQVDELQNIPADKLFAAASNVHIAGERPGALRGPVVDGHSLLKQPWEPQAPEESATVPMMVGTCSHEGTVFASWGSDQALFNLDEQGLRGRLVQSGIADAVVDQLLALYHRDHPQDSPCDLYFRIGADRGVRVKLRTQVERKIEQCTRRQDKANAYVYQFNWGTPTGDGRLKAFHTAGLPLAMRLALYPESEQLSKQIAGAWAAFARTGNPSHPGIPEWPAYTTAGQATMIWDAPECQVVNAPDAEARQILQAFPFDSMW